MAFHFFLGGNDLEMEEIRGVLGREGIPFTDKGLGWGASASSYMPQMHYFAKGGSTPVLVELEIDCELPQGTVVIDHHGTRAGEPASILQVLALIEVRPTRWHQLVAADDGNGGPVGLVAFGALPAEFAYVREAGRRVQGITADEEAEAERAVRDAERVGKLVIVRCSHSKCAPITDRLFPTWPDGRENVLIISGDGEANYFGDARVRNALVQKFGGWLGGNPDGNGYWGVNGIARTEVIKMVIGCSTT